MGSTGKVSDSSLAAVCSSGFKIRTHLGKTQICIALQNAQHKAFERILELVYIPTDRCIATSYRQNSCHGSKTLKGVSELQQYEMWCSALKQSEWVRNCPQRHDQDCVPSIVSIQLLCLLSRQNCVAWMSLSFDKIKLLFPESLAKKQDNGSLQKAYLFLPTISKKWIS